MWYFDRGCYVRTECVVFMVMKCTRVCSIAPPIYLFDVLTVTWCDYPIHQGYRTYYTSGYMLYRAEKSGVKQIPFGKRDLLVGGAERYRSSNDLDHQTRISSVCNKYSNEVRGHINSNVPGTPPYDVQRNRFVNNTRYIFSRFSCRFCANE